MPDIITLNRLAEIPGADLNYFSENFQSVTTEITSDESQKKQSTSQLSGKLKKRLSRDMSRWNWVDADFSRLKNLQEKFSSSNMKSCKFAGSEMSGLLLKRNNIDSCDFTGSDSSSHIQNSNPVNNQFKHCSLKETEFSENNINSYDLTGTDFTGVVL